MVSKVAELDEAMRIQVKNHPYFNTNIFTNTREAFLESFEKMTALLDDVQNGSCSGESSRDISSTQPFTPVHHRLPPLELHRFNGDHTEWLTFRDMFSSFVLKNPSSRIVSLDLLRHF